MKFKFITLNVEHGGRLLNEAVEFINKEQPDLLFLQEAQNTDLKTAKQHYRTISEIQSSVKFPYHIFSPYVEFEFDNTNVLHGNAIFSRYQLTGGDIIYFNGQYEKADFAGAKKLHDFTRLPHAMQTASMKLQDKEIFLVNVHGVWGTDGRDSPIRSHMVDLILTQIAGKDSVIVAGDFNFQNNTQAVKTLENHLLSVFGQRLTTTLNMKRKTDLGYASAAVDMVFVSNGISVITADCPKVEISDHLPLVCELEL